MAEARRDANKVTTLLGVSNADGITPVVLWADPTTHRLLVSAVSAGTTWYWETPVGAINGSNVTFTIANAPTANSQTLYLGGLCQYPTTDYSLSGTTITYVVAPDTGNTHRIHYQA